MALLRAVTVHGNFIYAPTGTREVVGGGLMVSRITDPDSKLTSGQRGVEKDELGKQAVKQMVEDIVLLSRIIKTGRVSLNYTIRPWP
ncbi:MAG: hypothetical protein ACTSVM_06730 [Candidatus Ranarchaeia archaeon]